MELPFHPPKTREPEHGEREIFCQIRKKWLVYTNEEVVRQALVQYLVEDKAVPKSLIAVERQVTCGKRPRRFDVCVLNPDGEAQLVAECKAPEVPLSAETLRQIGEYNLTLSADWLLITNGGMLRIFHRPEGERLFRQGSELPPHSEW